MTVKSLKKQLMAAIAMVLVATIALGSSTYAWFAANAKVTATGMQVQAAAEGGIEIAYTTSAETTGSYATSATAGATSASALAPTSTLDTTAWYHASASLASASAADPATYATLSITENAITGQSFGKLGGVTVGTDTTNYYMVQTFNIRSTSATSLGKGLTVDSVSVAGNSATMSQALRVAVVLGSKALIYDPVANDTTPYAVYSGYNATATPPAAIKAGDVTITDKDTATLLAAAATTEIPAKGASANGGVDVKVYVWFEGEDSMLYSENFSTEGLTVTVNFSATVQ